MGLNSTGTAYNFGQLGSVHMNNDHTETLTPPDGMVIVAITCLDLTKFSALTADTTNSLVYGGAEQSEAYFGIANANTGGNGEAVLATTEFPAGMTIYGRWTALSLVASQATGGVIAYFGY